MKVTLKHEFNLPDEQDQYAVQVKASEMAEAIEGFREWLRVTCKYGESGQIETDEVQANFYEWFEGVFE